MVEADEMQETVREQKSDLGRGRVLSLAGLPSCGVERDHDVPEEIAGELAAFAFAHREREDVGRTILAAVIAVELVDRRVVADEQRDLGAGESERGDHLFRRHDEIGAPHRERDATCRSEEHRHGERETGRARRVSQAES